MILQINMKVNIENKNNNKGKGIKIVCWKILEEISQQKYSSPTYSVMYFFDNLYDIGMEFNNEIFQGYF